MGKDFGTQGLVMFGDQEATQVSYSDTEIIVVAPMKIDGGIQDVRVVPYGSKFTYKSARIQNVVPSDISTSGGAVITITGKDLLNDNNQGNVSFHNTVLRPSSYLALTDTTIIFSLNSMPGGCGVTGPRLLYVNNFKPVLVSFNCAPPESPTMTLVSPFSGVVGTIVTVMGTRFLSYQCATEVLIGGRIYASPPTIVSATKLTFVVPTVSVGKHPLVVYANCRPSNTVYFTITSPPAFLSMNAATKLKTKERRTLAP
jgi:hypothetical protein